MPQVNESNQVDSQLNASFLTTAMVIRRSICVLMVEWKVYTIKIDVMTMLIVCETLVNELLWQKKNAFRKIAS